MKPRSRIAWLKAHPRSRGENQEPQGRLVVGAGSSPLTRGKHGLSLSARGLGGLIPAHAGKTPKSGRPPSWRAAHPRSRGENRTNSARRFSVSGSSPLTRGKPRPAREREVRERLIPAHAGKTSKRLPYAGVIQAHPRSRGENQREGDGHGQEAGSSPLTRGKRMIAAALTLAVGLIPAHAGKTDAARTRSLRCGAHPRSRGENAAGGVSGLLGGGSSPLTRGKRRARLPKGRRVRLIPAHAGKTPRRPPIRMSSPAHPRSRGENQRRSSARAGDTGSSPLTRGKRKRAAHAQRRRRLIPAHAGKT